MSIAPSVVPFAMGVFFNRATSQLKFVEDGQIIGKDFDAMGTIFFNQACEWKLFDNDMNPITDAQVLAFIDECVQSVIAHLSNEFLA
jgi:hypothetical protein